MTTNTQNVELTEAQKAQVEQEKAKALDKADNMNGGKKFMLAMALMWTLITTGVAAAIHQDVKSGNQDRNLETLHVPGMELKATTALVGLGGVSVGLGVASLAMGAAERRYRSPRYAQVLEQKVRNEHTNTLA